MSGTEEKGRFHASFIYSDAILDDFAALYRQKREMPLSVRLVLGVLGAAGALYFGYRAYREGFQVTYIGYLLISSMLLVLAFPRGQKRPDESVAKYRKYYHNRHVTFTIDDEGVEMHLEGQKNYARSKFKEIYGLFDTDLCFYFAIKGRAYYILSKQSVTGGTDSELAAYMQKKCGKRFIHYDIAGPS